MYFFAPTSPAPAPRSAISTFLFTVFGVLAMTGCGGAGASGGAASRDTFANFADLSAHEKEGSDFTVTVTDRRAPSSVFAFHGGRIDTGTEKIAAAVAGSDWNSYVLIGPSYRYHVTSANFDDPRIVKMAESSSHCVSIHGHKSDVSRICVGGADTTLRAQVAEKLSASGLPFEILTHCEGLDATQPSNPVNLCHEGVQLEFSGAARTQLFDDAALLSKTAKAIRAAVDSLPGPH